MLKRGDRVGETTTGVIGKLADIQYTSDRYQFEHINGWRYGIENLKFMDFNLEEVKEHFYEVDKKAQESEKILTVKDLDMIDWLIERIEYQEK